MAQRMPLVVVLGATACGKSKLAIELARKFCGEIISADSMQVYHGLNIVTNKVTEEEQSQAKHHMIDFMDPLQRYSVVDFRNQSVNIIDSLFRKKSLPILVGGTNYYIESILWDSFLVPNPIASKRSHDDTTSSEHSAENENVEESGTLIDEEKKILDRLPTDARHSDEDFESVTKFFQKPIYNDGFTHVESDKLWNILEQVDPKSAHLYHPKDKRRLIRCLQIIQRSKKNYSELLETVNRSKEGKKSLGGPLRYDKTCVFWLNCDNETLEKILDERVDQMLNRGLLAELEHFHENYNRQRLQDGEPPDYEKGIFQTIGFKEFHEYLLLDPEIKATEKGNQLLKESIERMRISTKQYARKQIRWIKRRFLESGIRDLPPIFKLDVSLDEDTWSSQVREPAFRIVERFLDGTELEEDLLKLKQPVEEGVRNDPGKLYCEPCDRTFIGTINIDQHLRSKNHARRVLKLKMTRTDSNEISGNG